MDLYDWLLALHILAACVLVAGMVILFVVLVRAARAPDDGAALARVAPLGGRLAGAGSGLALVLGLLLVLDSDAFGFLDGWVLIAIVLWAIGSAAGERSGRVLAGGPGIAPAARSQAIGLFVVSSLMVAALLFVMIYKPGA